MSGGVEVRYSPVRERARYCGLILCGLVWLCPLCAATIAEQRRTELEAAIASWRSAGGSVALLTFTYSHGPQDALRPSLARFLAAQRSMTGGRPFNRLKAAFGMQHSIKAVEVTWGARNGWHPHSHWLAFVAGGDLEPGALQDALYLLWSGAAARQGLAMGKARGLRVQATFGAVADYVSKFGHQPKSQPWGPSDELAKSHIKRARPDEEEPRYSPFDLLRWYIDSDDSEPLVRFREYAQAFRGRHPLQWSRGLRIAVGLGVEKSDEELAGEPQLVDELLAMLSRDQWRAIRWYHQQAAILSIAEGGTAGPVLDVADQLLIRYRVEVGSLYQPI